MRFKSRYRAFEPLEPGGWFTCVAALVPRSGSILTGNGNKHEGTVREVSDVLCMELALR